ncbi:hypothetical protein [Natronoglycomyces albus]|uniref:Uncharacterized protein n=1 Tax=Natronoglycomyces albus TaxID=2811108 RepID=A0A895XMN4_9ACTN|nr:hypothetical protein [Natronoglycomyces albus]QSB04659.1 hypothetical protein JQS30_12880 [Natronoglycomyces albus]
MKTQHHDRIGWTHYIRKMGSRSYHDRYDVMPDNHRGWTNRPHRMQTYEWPHLIEAHTLDQVRDGDSPQLTVPAEMAMLDILLTDNDNIGNSSILLLDGKLLCAGDGRYQIPLAPGPHTVEAQNVRAAQVSIVARAGERICLTTERGIGLIAQVKAPSEFLRPFQPPSRRRWRLGVLGLSTGAFGAAAAAGAPGIGALIGAMVLVVGLRLTMRTNHRTLLKAITPWNVDLGRSEQIDLPGAGQASQKTYRPVPRPRKKTTGLLVEYDLRLHRVAAKKSPWESSTHTGDSPSLVRAYAAPPKIRIDGHTLPSTWGAWLYELKPGTYEVNIGVDADTPNQFAQRNTGRTTQHRTAQVTIRAGKVTKIRARAHVYRVWRPENDQVESFTPRLDLRLSVQRS